MSRFFGEIRQAGYVVHDIEKAMDYWSQTLGIGPWFYNPRVPIVNYRYRGGYCTIDDTPGIGVDIDEEAAKNYPYVAASLPVNRRTDGTMFHW